MTVKSGRNCGVALTTRGGGLSNLSIAERPAHGVAAPTSKTAWGYRSLPNYVGKDQFVVRTSGELMGRFVVRGDTSLTVNVDVVP